MGNNQKSEHYNVLGYVVATVATISVTAIGWPLYHQLGLANANVLMLYLLGILWVATRHSRGAAVYASVLSVVAFDLVFVPPYYTLAVSERQYLVTFAVMLLTSLIISTLTHRVRTQAKIARLREHRTATLFAFSRDLAATASTDEIVQTTLRHVQDVLGHRVILLLGENKHLVRRGDSAGNDSHFDDGEMARAQWAYEKNEIAGRGDGGSPSSAGLYIPLRASRGAHGVLGLIGPAGSALLADQRQLAEAFAAQTALAVERTTLAHEARVAWERVEAEFLRNTLLNSVSHDLRTPLAAISGTAETLLRADESLDIATRRDLTETVLDESRRMQRVISNLLDMTRVESGALQLERHWQPLAEVVGAALHEMKPRLADRQISVELSANLPLAKIDEVSMQQVLMNLLGNAVEYTPPASALEITAGTTHEIIWLEVADHGPGIPAGKEQQVFQKFFRAHNSTSRRGIGLGLAICRGFIEAHGGEITARNRPQGGAVFRIELPLEKNPPPPEN